MKRMKKVTTMIIAASMLLGLCACGSGEADNTSQGETAAPAAQETDAPEENTAQETTEATGGETKDSLILVTAGEPYRFYAQGSQGCGGDDNLALSNIYDCLLFLEPDGSLSPALAESYDVSEDGLTYTFHLRQGVKFQNGEEMTAADVQKTFELGAAGPLGANLFINFESCDIVDDYTVEIHLSSAYAAFPYGVASRIGGIICKSYYDEVGEDGYYEAPVGTGPYKFVEYVKGDHTTLEANEDYWRGAPAIKNVVIQTVADASTQILGLQNGDYDVVRDPAIDVCLSLNDDPTVKWDKENSVGRVTMYMNSWDAGPGKDINFRKAIQAAINKDDVNEAMYGGEGDILDIDVCASYGGCPDPGTYEVPKYDVEAAKQYLADSSYNGEEWKILVQSGTRYEIGAKVIQAQLMSVGINCVLDAKDNATYREEYMDRTWQAIIADNLSSLVDADGLMVITAWRASGIPQHREVPAMRKSGI